MANEFLKMDVHALSDYHLRVTYAQVLHLEETGELLLYARKAIETAGIAELKDVMEAEMGKRWYKEHSRKKRSEKQNRYLWGGIMEPLAKSSGYTKEEVYGMMELKHCDPIWHKVGERLFPIVPEERKFKNLTTAEFSKLVEVMVLEGQTDWGVPLELPCPKDGIYVKNA